MPPARPGSSRVRGAEVGRLPREAAGLPGASGSQVIWYSWSLPGSYRWSTWVDALYLVTCPRDVKLFTRVGRAESTPSEPIAGAFPCGVLGARRV